MTNRVRVDMETCDRAANDRPHYHATYQVKYVACEAHYCRAYTSCACHYNAIAIP